MLEEWSTVSTGFLSAADGATPAACPPLYRGKDGMDSLCTKLLQDCEATYSTPVCSIERDDQSPVHQWVIRGKDDAELARVDHVIVTSMAIASSVRWERLFGGLLSNSPISNADARYFYADSRHVHAICDSQDPPP